MEAGSATSGVFVHCRTVSGRLQAVATTLLFLFGGRARATTIAIDDVSVSEAAGSAVFTVSLDAPATSVVTVDYATFDGTATGGADFTTVPPTTLTFQPDDLTMTVSVPILEDTLYEATEEFTVVLSNASGATIADDTGIGSITDDDPVPMIGFTTASAGAFESAPTLTAIVQVSPPAGVDLTIPFSVGGTASDPADYSITSSPLVIPAGASSGSIVVNIVPDTIDENDETVIVTLSPPGGGSGGIVTWTGTIFDNDASPGLTIGDVTVDESIGLAIVYVSLSEASGLPISVEYSTQDGSAIATQDYTAIPPTVLSFAPGETVQSFNVTILNDALNEPTESLTANLNNAVNAAISRATGFLTILDDDPLPSISVSDITVPEGGGPANFIVSLSSPSGQTISVDAVTQDGTALAGLDYTSVSVSRFTFAPGQSIRLVPVPLIDDSLIESPETFSLVLSGAENATIADDTGVATITDNDAFYTTDFARYMDITIETGDPVGQYYSVGFTIGTAALIASGQAKSDGSDLALAWDPAGDGNWIEIDAHLRPAPNQTLATSAQTQIWFAINEPGGITPPWANRYRLYYGNPLAVPSVRRRDEKLVYRLFDDFDGTALDASLWYVHPAYRPAVSVSGGIMQQDGALSPGNVWQGLPIRMVSQTDQNVPTFTVSYSQPWAVECRFRSLNISDDVHPANALMHMTPPGFPVDHDEYSTFLHSNGSASVRLLKVSNNVSSGLFSAPNVIATSVWYDMKMTSRLTVTIPGQERSLHSVYLNDALVGDSSAAPKGGYDPTITSGQVGIETDPGTKGQYDWFLVRDFTANEPGLVFDPYVNLKMMETPNGTEADWSDPGGARSWDVIRGQIQFIVESGNTVDLGPVLCLENDSIDTTTGPDHLDTAVPAPGNVFFYLVRTKGSHSSGTYGHSTKGGREVPSSGDCF